MRELLLLSLLLMGCSQSTDENPTPDNHEKPAIESRADNQPIVPVVDIKHIAMKPKATVDAYLGKPAECENSKYGTKCVYQKHGTEIVYINGAADWITVNEVSSVPLTAEALRYFGLAAEHPSFEDQEVMRWSGIQGYRSMSLAKSGGKAWYFYMKATTN